MCAYVYTENKRQKIIKQRSQIIINKNIISK